MKMRNILKGFGDKISVKNAGISLVFWILAFGLIFISAMTIATASNGDDGEKEFCGIDVTKTPDAKAFVDKMKTIEGWANTGKEHPLEKGGVIWDTDSKKPNVEQCDLEHAGKDAKSQADILYVASHGARATGKLSYSDGRTIIADPKTFTKWNGDLEYAVIAACVVLNVNFDKQGKPTGGTGLDWAKLLRGKHAAHGLLGYEGKAPVDPDDSKIAIKFVDMLKAGKTFKDAWKEANEEVDPNRYWAVIINKKNIEEKLSDIDTDADSAKDYPKGRLWYYSKTRPKKGLPITVALSAKSSGAFENKFKKNVDDVYVKGTLLPPGQSVRIYINKDTTLSDGNAIPSDVRGNYQTHPISDTTDIFVKIWDKSALIIDKYDIVVDVNANGTYDEDIDIIDSMETVGFEVIPEFPTIAIPVVAILGLLFLTYRKKQKGNQREYVKRRR